MILIIGSYLSLFGLSLNLFCGFDVYLYLEHDSEHYFDQSPRVMMRGGWVMTWRIGRVRMDRLQWYKPPDSERGTTHIRVLPASSSDARRTSTDEVRRFASPSRCEEAW